MLLRGYWSIVFKANNYKYQYFVISKKLFPSPHLLTKQTKKMSRPQKCMTLVVFGPFEIITLEVLGLPFS